ncbi:Rv3235 family protein [Streptomyces sp. NPDC049555]|uniref:Rv3235 family protein n=1 Tax=Streptomyces sp. NPDC049555 TaxID=3154930 RepID=UPI00342370B7
MHRSQPNQPAAGRPPRPQIRRTDSRRPGAGLAARYRQPAARHPRHWFAERLLLTLSGQRPVHWMLGHALPRAYDQLVELAPAAPLRPVPPDRAAPYVRHCDEFQPRPGVIEAFARIATGDRLQALAFRLERCPDERWRCAAVELGGVRAR